MGFLLRCPNCGERDVYEFRFGGEINPRPSVSASPSEKQWSEYIYMRKNLAGVEKEWWYHRLGCKKWFLAFRDTRNNTVVKTFLQGEDQS
jgi:heterotetrameric sarcosine oxidase delta subunit